MRPRRRMAHVEEHGDMEQSRAVAPSGTRGAAGGVSHREAALPAQSGVRRGCGFPGVALGTELAPHLLPVPATTSREVRTVTAQGWKQRAGKEVW